MAVCPCSSCRNRGHAGGCCIVQVVLDHVACQGRVGDRAQDLPCIDAGGQGGGWNGVGEGAGHWAGLGQVAQQAGCGDDVILGHILSTGLWRIACDGCGRARLGGWIAVHRAAAGQAGQSAPGEAA